ncbi:MAG: metallophosphoesterase family protein [Henriciella sp.]
MRTITYAIGDVHGEAVRLRQLHASIFERHAFEFGDAIAKIVHLGDYVDRGPDSADVIEAVMELESRSGLQTVALKGNHEAMLIEGLTAAHEGAYDNWLVNGGDATVQSYKDRGHDTVLKTHLSWLKARPNIHVDAAQKLIFVHAGIQPQLYPDDRSETYLWTRSRRFFEVQNWKNEALIGWTVIHGHTPTDDYYPEIVEAQATRINLDTGAVFGGRLTAAVIAPGEKVRFIYS